ncbi:MAG: diguanylate cyclase [Syntrophomonadaceae bacterium]|nr:diguanylate cyclase [Syntrophomonadaceae bacterium]
MNQKEKKRREKIAEYVAVTHISGFLIGAMAIIKTLNLNLDESLRPVFPAGLLVALLLYLAARGALAYLAKNERVKGVILGIPAGLHLGAVGILVAVVTLVLWFSGQGQSQVKVLYTIPIILAAVNHGKIPGLAAAAAASLVMIAVTLSGGPVNLEPDLVFAGVFILLAWLIGGLRDVENEAREHLVDMVNTDDITGLINHRHFQERLDALLAGARPSGFAFTLIVFDIDYFKHYNNTFGHRQGDQVLVEIGGLLKEMIPVPGFAARLGHDEFAVVLPGISLQEATAFSEKLRAQINGQEFFGGQVQPGGRITVSIGVTAYPDHGSNKQDLVRAAFEALEKAKVTNKNRVEVYFSVFEDLKKSMNESERDLLSSVRTLLGVINAKDKYTYGHSERVVQLCRLLARRAGMNEKEERMLAYAAFLHDIGKIEVPREVLNKVEPLLPEEWETLKMHPLWGIDIIRPAVSLQEAIPVIKHHHENYNGTGYPEGISGKDIPYGARVLRIIDSFDAMTTHRPYRRGISLPEALQELAKGSGSLYDPELVKGFVICMEELKESREISSKRLNI